MEESAKINEKESFLRDLKSMAVAISDLEAKLNKQIKINKLKDEFIMLVSHEIRTPLTIIKGNICNLMDGVLGEFTEKQMRSIEVTNRNIDRLIRMVNGLLDFTNMEHGLVSPKLSRVNIESLVKEVVDNFETVSRTRKIDLSMESPKNLVDLDTDADLTSQILTNLLDHSLQYAKKEAKVVVQLVKEGIQVTVMDDGPRLPREEPGIIFDKMVSTNKSAGSVGHRGTGLILAMCKEQIQWLKGKMWVENRSQGASVHFLLPHNPK